ncbi:IS1634 family transposase [Patescibacteria group bacterium]|nr:IS1634 family transposase [Patescibacteria group bacterium]
MFIKTSIRKIKGKEYKTRYLTEGYRDKKTGVVKHRHILSLSKLPEKQILALQASLNNNTKIEKVKLEDLELIACKEYGSIAVFEKLFDKVFGKIIPKEYEKEIKAIVINKIFDPKSKNGLNNWLKQVDLNYQISNKNKLYECLDELEEQQIAIEKRLFDYRKIKKADLFLYDVTSTYFEGKGAEELCKYGYSRDHRNDRLQINIGLVTDDSGVPLCVEIFEGNITDKQTLQGKINQLKDRFNIQKITFVFDRGMKTKMNLNYLQEQEFDFITCLSHSELKKRAEENEKIQRSLFDKQNLAEFIIDEKYIDEKGIEKTRQKKLILCFNPSKAVKDQKTRLDLIQSTEKKLLEIQNFKKKYSDLELQNKVSKKINKFNCEKYIQYEIKNNKLSFERNGEKINQAEKYDGFYMIETSCLEIKKEQAQMKYKSLQIVERAFDSIKNHIQIRPVFHYKASRIKGHIFTCFMAYYLLHFFREKTKELLKEHTLDDLLTELKCIQKSYFKIGNFNFAKITKLNDIQKEIFSLFYINYSCCAQSADV